MSVKLGIALGSGGARGWAHIGVVLALAEAGITPDIACGTSVGAVIGALAIAGKLPEFALYTRRLTRVRLSQLFDFKFGSGGIIAGNRLLKVLNSIFANGTIERLPRPFACVATDLATGDEVWLRHGRIVDALRASYAIPGLFPPAQIGGRWLMDGALVNPVPVSLARALGADVVIAVDVNAGLLAPLSFDDDQLGLGERGAIGAGFMRYFGRRKSGPNPFGVIARSLQIGATRLSRIRLAEDPPALVLRPDVGHIGPLEFHRASAGIAAGEMAVRAALPAIRELLSPRPAPAPVRPARGGAH